MLANIIKLLGIDRTFKLLWQKTLSAFTFYSVLWRLINVNVFKKHWISKYTNSRYAKPTFSNLIKYILLSEFEYINYFDVRKTPKIFLK